MRLSRALLVPFVVSSLAACGVILDIESEPVPPGTPDGSVEGSTGGEGGGGDSATDGSSDGPTDGGTDAPVRGCNGAVACDRLVFVTELSASATDVASADAFCLAQAERSAADAELKGRAWTAWVSPDPTGKSVKARLVHGTGKYKLLSNETIADNWDKLVDGIDGFKKAIDFTETKTRVNTAQDVWTGTTALGDTAVNTCGAWTSKDAGDATGGSTDNVIGWSDSRTIACSRPARIYCIER